MSDFDEVLERLLLDPAFKAALAANPQGALAGYDLAPDERELLGVQLVSGVGEDRTVELRTTKSGVIGLVGPVAAAIGVAAGGVPGGALSGSQAFGQAPGSNPVAQPLESFGGAKETPLVGNQVLGHIDQAVGAHEQIGTAAGTGTALGDAPAEATGYHTRVDVDGDGTWDEHRAYQRADGGVDIVADADNDGRIDFVGHDLDRDGRIDVAEFDNDGDGALETRMYDDTGDGYLDRAEHVVRGPVEGFGPAPR